MKLVVLAVGKIKSRDAWSRDGCDEYAKRISHYLPIDVREVKTDAELTRAVPERHRIVALDERGREWSSSELAVRVQSWMSSGVSGVALLLGGADGLPAPLMARADEKISLSRLTLPHRLARVVLLEQLYRALTILRGEPYHRE